MNNHMNSFFVTPNDCPGADDSASIQNAVDHAHETGINLVLIPRINERTGDDLIAFSAIDTRRKDQWNLIVEVEDPGIHDITVRNVSGAAVGHPLIAMRCANDARLYNILIENAKDIPFFAPVRLSNPGKPLIPATVSYASAATDTAPTGLPSWERSAISP